MAEDGNPESPGEDSAGTTPLADLFRRDGACGPGLFPLPDAPEERMAAALPAFRTEQAGLAGRLGDYVSWARRITHAGAAHLFDRSGALLASTLEIEGAWERAGQWLEARRRALADDPWKMLTIYHGELASGLLACHVPLPYENTLYLLVLHRAEPLPRSVARECRAGFTRAMRPAA